MRQFIAYLLLIAPVKEFR